MQWPSFVRSFVQQRQVEELLRNSATTAAATQKVNDETLKQVERNNTHSHTLTVRLRNEEEEAAVSRAFRRAVEVC